MMRVLLLSVAIMMTSLSFAYAQAAPQEPAANDVRLALPPVLYACPGLEASVYFDDVVLVINPVNYAFDVTCGKGQQQAERWTFTPAAEDIGDYGFTLAVRDGANRVMAQASSIVRVVKPDAGAERAAVSVLFIGDSLTNASVYPLRVMDLFSEKGAPPLTLVGMHVPRPDTPELRHEGFGGWTAKRFATRFDGRGRTGEANEWDSPFLYLNADNKPTLDFAQYCRDANGGQAPDFVTIFLGCNDTFGATDETIEATIDDMFIYMDALIQMIRAYSPQTYIGLILPVPPAATQDAFGANYGCGQTRWQYKRNQHRVVERMTERYGAREAENVTLIPSYVNLDTLHGFPQTQGPWNAQTAQQTARLNNGVHPSEEGYRQIGDSVYSWMRARLAAAQ